jgi:hypothetical protein
MSKYIARLVKVGVGKEATRGAGASPTYTIPFVKLSFDDKIVQARSNAALGDLADSEEAFVTTKYGQGDMDIELRSKSLGLLLLSLLGSSSVSGPVDSAYTHTFSIVQSNQHQSLSFVVEDANTTELYKLVMLDSFKLTGQLDKVVTATLGFMSKCARDTGLTAPSVVAENKWTKKHINIKVADDVAGLSAASNLSMKTINFNVMKNVAIDDTLGSAEPEDILNNQFAVEGELELNYDSEVFKQYMLNGTYKAMQIELVNTDQVIGASTSPLLRFIMPKVDFHSWAPNYDLDKITIQKLSFKASKDVENDLDIISSCVLINDVTSY